MPESVPNSDSENDVIDTNLFEEPDDFRPDYPREHFVTYERPFVSPQSRSQQREIELRLVGSSPLWGHLLWNAGKYTAQYLDSHVDLVLGKTVLELGAAAALPSVVAGLIGAKNVVATDYPDADLISNIEWNCKKLSNVCVEGYIWGNDFKPLLDFNSGEKFDLLLLSDLVFNHSEHDKLLRTVKGLLKGTGKALVVFSPHRPKLLNEDLRFFEKAESEYELDVEKIEVVNWQPMFAEDPGSPEVRSRIYSFFLTHRK